MGSSASSWIFLGCCLASLGKAVEGHAAFEFTLQNTTAWTHPMKAYEVQTETYESQAFPLNPGQMLFTQPSKTPLKMPNGTFAITGFLGEVVDGDGNSVPLNEIYDHHWIAVDTQHRNPLCGPEYVFGIGAESRRTPASFPAGFGYIVKEGDEWGGNIHLLRTEHLAGPDPHVTAKECNECWYAPGKGPDCNVVNNGTFQCCGDACYDGSCKCPTAPDAPVTSKDFRLKYTLNYTKDIESIAPLGIGVFTTPNCAAFYDVQRNDDQPESLSTTTFTSHADAIVRLGIGHQHVGSLNISMFVNDKFVCASFPTYGTQTGIPGDEKGFLVKMSHCVDESTGPVSIKKGDKVRLDSWYWVGSEDRRIAPIPGGSHLNVMGYMYLAFEVENPKDASQTHLLTLMDAGEPGKENSFQTYLTDDEMDR